MRKTIISAISLLAALLSASAQNRTDTDGEKTVMGVTTRPWKSPATVTASELPSSVDNSINMYFPPIFNQIGNSMSQNPRLARAGSGKN